MADQWPALKDYSYTRDLGQKAGLITAEQAANSGARSPAAATFNGRPFEGQVGGKLALVLPPKLTLKMKWKLKVEEF